MRRAGFWGGIVFFCALSVLPSLWALATIFRQNADLYVENANPFLYKHPPTLEHLLFLFRQTHFAHFAWNSAFVGTLVVAITLLFSVPAAYSLARLSGRWGERSGIVLFLVYLIPPTLLFIPLYRVVVYLGLANSVWALVLVHPTITIPFCTWLLLGFFKSIPRELDESALIDGCSRWQAFYRVSLPLALPGIGACVVFAFSLSISDYIYAATFITSTVARSISAGVPTELIRGDVFFWQSLMAATSIVALPLAMAFGLLFERLVSGFQSS